MLFVIVSFLSFFLLHSSRGQQEQYDKNTKISLQRAEGLYWRSIYWRRFVW
jgi:hypothetical protein